VCESFMCKRYGQSAEGIDKGRSLGKEDGLKGMEVGGEGRRGLRLPSWKVTT